MHRNKSIRVYKRGLTCPLAGSGIGTGGAATLLEMEAAAATPNAKGVGLVPPLTKAPCSLTLYYHKIKYFHTDQNAHIQIALCV